MYFIMSANKIIEASQISCPSALTMFLANDILNLMLRHNNNKVIWLPVEEFHGLVQINSKILLVIKENDSKIQNVEKLRY